MQKKPFPFYSIRCGTPQSLLFGKPILNLRPPVFAFWNPAYSPIIVIRPLSSLTAILLLILRTIPRVIPLVFILLVY